MRLSRPAAVAGAALLIGGLGFSTADAAGSLSKTNLLPQGETITVSYNNITIPAGNSNVVFIQQCRKDDSGVFNQLNDCSQATGINPAYPGTGQAAFAVFGGDDPNDTGWGCGPLATVPLATCYIRIAPGSDTNTASDEFYPVTFTAVGETTTTTIAPTTTTIAPTTTTIAPTTTTIASTTTTVVPPNDVPEVPMNVLLPLGAAAVLGGSIVVARRRQNNAA